MHIRVDKSGRIVLPKKLRDALNLQPGSKLQIHRKGQAIILSPGAKKSALIQRNGRWVHTGKLVRGFSIQSFLNTERSQRLDSL